MTQVRPNNPINLENVDNNSNGNYLGFNHHPDKNAFVSKVALWQTNPHKADYTIYVQILINPFNQSSQEVRFSYKPDNESLKSVVDEMIDALKLNKTRKNELINSIENTMNSKKMCIVKKSPFIITNNQPQNKNKNISPKKGVNYNNYGHHKLNDDTEDFTFYPLSPLVVSPRTLHRKHRKSSARFPVLKNSMSLSESDHIIGQVDYDIDYNNNFNNFKLNGLDQHIIIENYKLVQNNNIVMSE